MIFRILLLLVSLLLFWGGLGIMLPTTAALGFIFSLIVFIFWHILNGSRIEKPVGLELYLAFLVVILAPLFTGKLGLEGKYFLMLFLGGGALWLVFYNLPKIFADKFSTIIVFLGLIFAALFVIYILLGRVLVGGWNLYLFSTIDRNHNHLGDLWALVEIVTLYNLIKTRRWYWWILGLSGIFFLAVSFSRSAYIALFVGVVYLVYRKNWLKKYSKIVIPALVVPTLLFLVVGLFKTTLYSRGYFIQGILGLIKYPLGVGLGNFAKVSNESAFAHNIVLEVLVGVGLLGLVFVSWFFKVLLDLSRRGNILYSALFVALSVNFFFDTTYYIPTMIWLWFVCLGLSQRLTSISVASASMPARKSV